MITKNSRPLLYPESIKQEESSSQEQEIVVKNIDTGEIQSGNQLTKKLNSISISNKPWEHYFNSRKKLDQKLLQLVTKKDHTNLQALLIEFPIDLNALRFLGGWTLLHFAISKSDIVAADILLKFGLDVNSTTDEMHRTALHEAALGNKIQIVELLVGWGADPNICDSDRNTAMHFAVDYGYLEVVKALLASSTSVDLNLRNNTNMTPFNTCRNSEIFEILIMYEEKMSKTSETHSKKTADTNLKNSTSRTIYQSRLIVRNSDIIPNISRADQVEKFLSLRQNPIEKKPSNASNDSVISEQSYEESLVQDAPQPQIPLNSSKSKQKIKRIGSGLRNKLTKSSFRIASQNIGLMRQSIFKTHLQNQEVIDNYNILRKIGSGAFGKVYLVRKKRSNKLFALKQMEKSRIAQQGLRRYVDAERFVLTQINHPFLLHASYCLQDFNNLYILTEYCAGGDLQKIVRLQQLEQKIAKTYICQAALGLQELHKNKVLYRDLKASNTLLDSQGHIRLADFGLAKNAVTSASFLGSMNYIAPEMLVFGEQKNHGQALDWYLLGVLAYELLHGIPPFYSQDRCQMQKKVRKEDPQIKENLSSQCKQFLMGLLQKDPSKRVAGLNKLKQSAWLKEVDWKAIYERKGEVLKLQVPNLKSLLKKEYFEQQFNHQLIDQNIEWYDNWNYAVTQ